MIDKMLIETDKARTVELLCDGDAFFSESVRSNYKLLTEWLINRGFTVTTMESCTSGLIASLITDTEGASKALKGALITYSNEAKIMSGVSESVIRDYGVYSLETAVEMAKSCRETFGADIGIGVTGTLGNTDPSNSDSIPGEVFLAVCTSADVKSYRAVLSGIATRNEWKFAVARALFSIFEKDFFKFYLAKALDTESNLNALANEKT